MSLKSDAINFLFNQPQWVELVNLEKKLREDFILKLMGLPIHDNNHDKQVYYYKGAVAAIQMLWNLRDVTRKEKGTKNDDKFKDEEQG